MNFALQLAGPWARREAPKCPRWYALALTKTPHNTNMLHSGDRILVQKHDATQGHWFEGGVHVLHQTEVGLRFHGSFNGIKNQRFNARFKLNRIPMRRQHQAMDSAFSQPRVLFPVKAHLPPGPYPTPAEKRLKLFNPLLASNTPQLQAVISIVAQLAGAVPFVIFGP
jgi:helicase MOV-10